MTVESIARVRFGNHSNVADHTSTPGTLGVVECMSAEGLLPRQNVPIERDLMAADGGRYPAIVGVQDLSPITLKTMFRGVNSNTGGAVSDWEAKMEQGYMLASFFGAVGDPTASAAPTISGVASTTLTVSSNVLADKDIILIPCSAATGTAEIRQVVSGGGTTSPVVDRTLQGTFTNGGTVVRLARYQVDTSITQHAPSYIEGEWVDAADIGRAYFGCVPESLELDFPSGDMVSMQTVWQPNSWTDLAAANPTYAAPTTGSAIVVADARFMIANAEFLLENAKLSIKHTLRYRAATTGQNGRLGAVIRRKHDIVLSGRMFVGDNASSLGEVQDDSGTPTLSALLEDASTVGGLRTTRDISLQVGTVAGSCMYLRIPAADFRGQVSSVDGVTMYDFTAIATRPASGSESFYLGVG